MKVEVPKKHIQRPNQYTNMVQWVLQRDGMVGNGRGPWQRNAIIYIFLMKFFGLYIQLCPLGKAQKAYFSTFM